MIIPKYALVAGLMAAALVSTQARAGAFVGLNIGQSTVKDFLTEDEILASGPYNTASVEDTDTGFKIYVGTELSDFFALRAGYADLGEATTSGTVTFVGTDNESVAVTAFFVDAMVQVKPVENFKLFAKLGVAHTTVEDQFDATVNGPSSNKKGSEVEFVPGIGAAFEPIQNLGITLEYERYLDAGKEDSRCNPDCEFDIDVVSIGAYLNF